MDKNKLNLFYFLPHLSYCRRMHFWLFRQYHPLHFFKLVRLPEAWFRIKLRKQIIGINTSLLFVLGGTMDSKDLYKELEKDNAAQIILALSKLYNQLRQQRLVKWVEAYPEYWHMLCNPASPETARSVTPEIAEQVMKTLQEYDQTELQMVWLFRYGTLLDVFGNATDEKIQ